jgi:hypothetical protein
VVTRGRKYTGAVVVAGLGVDLLKVLVALDGHALETVGVEGLVRVGAVDKRRGTAWRNGGLEMAIAPTCCGVTKLPENPDS